MMSFQITEWLAIAAAVLLVLVCAGVVWRAVWLPSDVRSTSCCGACGHPVGDLGTQRCAECGGLYSRVGVSTPSMVVRYRAGLGWALLAWTTLVMAIGGVVLSIQQQQVAMQAWTMATPYTPASTAQQIRIENDYRPYVRNGSAPQFRASVAVDAAVDDDIVTSGSAKLRLLKTGTAERYTLEMNLPDGAYVIKGTDGQEVSRGESVDESSIEFLFDNLNIGMPPAQSLAFSRQFARILNEVRLDPESLDHDLPDLSFGSSSEPMLMPTGSSSSSGPIGGFTPPPAFATPKWWSGMIVSGPILGTLWIVGLVMITLRNRRLLRPAGSAHAT